MLLIGSATDDVIRHPILYFHDGNVVLSAAMSDGAIYGYRVHQSVLSLHSPVFRDMFLLPVEGEDCPVNETYDGVPLVYLPDRCEDVQKLLAALYDPSLLPFERYNPNTPLDVLGVLRLSKKYQIDHLHHRIVCHIEADWPKSLSEWDRLQDEIRSWQFDHLAVRETLYVDDHFPEPAAAILLAREFDIHTILPAAFYQLSLVQATEDWDEYRGTEEGRHELSVGVRTARWNLVQHDDFICVLNGLHHLPPHSKLRADVETSIGPMLCGPACREALVKAAEGSPEWITSESRHPLWFCNTVYDRPVLEARGMCYLCIEKVVDEMEGERLRIWDSLPGLFLLCSAGETDN